MYIRIRKISEAKVIGHLGPEPLERSFSAKRLEEMLGNRRGRLKPLLLDQKFIAGIGNIYADEACFLSGLHPARPVDDLSFEEIKELAKNIKKVLRHGITAKGASFDQHYRGGSFQNSFRVYSRTGEPCTECSTPIKRTLIAQRSTHFCPSCQPL